MTYKRACLYKKAYGKVFNDASYMICQIIDMYESNYNALFKEVMRLVLSDKILHHKAIKSVILDESFNISQKKSSGKEIILFPQVFHLVHDGKRKLYRSETVFIDIEYLTKISVYDVDQQINIQHFFGYFKWHNVKKLLDKLYGRNFISHFYRMLIRNCPRPFDIEMFRFKE